MEYLVAVIALVKQMIYPTRSPLQIAAMRPIWQLESHAPEVPFGEVGHVAGITPE
jgi:hypothetical protein